MKIQLAARWGAWASHGQCREDPWPGQPDSPMPWSSTARRHSWRASRIRPTSGQSTWGAHRSKSSNMLSMPPEMLRQEIQFMLPAGRRGSVGSTCLPPVHPGRWALVSPTPPGVLTLSTAALGPGHSLWWAVLCTAGCWAGSLVSTHQVLMASSSPPPSHGNQKHTRCQMSPGGGQDYPWLRITGVNNRQMDRQIDRIDK